MIGDNVNIRKLHFIENWLTWTALHHFLSAPLLRELVYVIVEQLSARTLRFEDLFEEVTSNGPACIDSWLIRPLETHTPLAKYLQLRIRGFLLQSDPRSHTPMKEEEPTGAVKPNVLDRVIELGFSDFKSAEPFLKNFKSSGLDSFDQFIRTFKLACESLPSLSTEEFASSIEESVTIFEMPLVAVIMKHFGDLCAYIDDWDKALALYERADCKVTDDNTSAWVELNSSIHAIIVQSKAAALRTLTGGSSAATLLFEAFDQTNLHNSPLLFGNGSFDALVASIHAFDSKNLPADRRATILLPPLLHRTHMISIALENWLGAKFEDAYRRFWAILRRQIALGSASESRVTKALYARSLLDEMHQKIARQHLPKVFNLAIRLLIESENSKSVPKLDWNEQLIDTYVDQQCVDFIIAHAQAHIGSLRERQLVVVELFQTWTTLIRIDHADIAKSMLKYIAILSLEPSSFVEDLNLGGRCLEALLNIAQKRPELRYAIVSEVTTSVCQNLVPLQVWRSRELALEIALEFVDLFPSGALQGVLDSTFHLLDKMNPDAGMWPVVRPALNLLTTQPIRDLAKQTPNLEKRIVETILRYGLEQESEHTRLFFYLHNFDKSLLHDTSIRDKLQDTISQVRTCAKEINSSNAVEHIQALLLAPNLSGLDGVKDALDGLSRILLSAHDEHPCLALPFAYDPLLQLVEFQGQIARDISVKLDTFRSWLLPIYELTTNLWIQAKERPLVFATFSFPPATKPDPVIVHNWAFASFRLAETIQQGMQIQEAIAAAATQTSLRDAIALARSTRLASGDIAYLDVDEIRKENRDAFYTALGSRLVLIQRLDIKQRGEFCKALLDQCLILGPRALDAAVFLSAISLNLSEYFGKTNNSDYIKRLDNNRELKLALSPLINMLREKSGLN